MNLQRRCNKDQAGAVLITALGVAVTFVGKGYGLGTLTQMGPGYMPTAIGVLLIVVGILIGMTANPAKESVPAAKVEAGYPSPRACVCILGGVAAFIVIGTHGGLVPAAFACVFISALADRTNSVRDAALLAAALVAASYVIFSWALKLPLAPFSWG